MKYAGDVTPYKGLRVYTRDAVGLPGSSEHLDELMYRILGTLIHDGHVTKIADDHYVGANHPDTLVSVWEKVLIKFQ